MNNDKIIIKGARTHNLKNINVEIPKNKLVAICGLSGSGKSSLAFDTLYAEGQRRYVESLSAYARQFLGVMDKPDVDSIEFITPAISIEQKSISKNPRSTVGTITEIHDYLRLLFARLGDVHCPECDTKVERYTATQIVDTIMEYPENSSLEIMSPIVMGRKGSYKNLLQDLLKDFIRVKIDNKIVRLDEEIILDKNIKHDIAIVVDRIKIKEESRRRITDSVEIALGRSKGLVELVIDGKASIKSENFTCLACGTSIAEIEPRTFSFNNPYGACKECYGLGFTYQFDLTLLVPDETKSVREGAIKLWEKTESYNFYSMLSALSSKYGIDMNKPWEKLSEESKNILLFGAPDQLKITTEINDIKRVYMRSFKGAVGQLEEMSVSDSSYAVDRAKKYRSESGCLTCGGSGLKKEALSVYLKGRNIFDVSNMSISESYDFIDGLAFDNYKQKIADTLSKEIKGRLKFLLDVGLDYMSLSRKAKTLSGGESQRIRLATQIGSGLTGVLYVLDEPSIGLHQRDNNRLIETLEGLRDLGNTVVVVEHDEDTLLRSDYIIDIGPRAGRLGGEVVFNGTPEQLLKDEHSLTGKYLSNRMSIPLPKKRRKSKKYLEIKGAKENNLKNIDVKIPLGIFSCITGVSGSGKSSLITNVLYTNTMRELHGSSNKKGSCEAILGLEHIDKVIDINQYSIGRTPHSNPATYTGVFTDIRDLFAMLPESKKRGYTIGRFSFNTKMGRCGTCEGKGQLKIAMHFMPDLHVECDECKGKRYNRDTLEVLYNKKSIFDILDMTINEACDFFMNIPKIKNKLDKLDSVGIGYMKLGQPSTTLSGGEAQRIMLSKELLKVSTGKTLYIFDEPTTGLHFDDVNKLIKIFNQLADEGNTVIVIEHNLDVIKCADYIIDLGPDSGHRGGEVVATGTPEQLSKNKQSFTAEYMKRKLI